VLNFIGKEFPKLRVRVIGKVSSTIFVLGMAYKFFTMDLFFLHFYDRAWNRVICLYYNIIKGYLVGLRARADQNF
jgi:hypothetical protein